MSLVIGKIILNYGIFYELSILGVDINVIINLYLNIIFF